jgi:hypothetical protein
MNSTKVTVWLSSDAWTRYSIEAGSRRIPLATHLRERLEQQDRLIADVVVRTATECSATTQAGSTRATPAGEHGILVEALLLLRSIAGPQRSAVAQKEVERRGLPSWS